jgi:PadR family transcriptional regulator, regulatory protein PadR
MRKTKQTQLVLDTLARANRWMHGYEIMQKTGLKSGTLYPILDRLVANKLATQKHERINPRTAGRPPRIYYQATTKGRKMATLWRIEQ